MRIILVSQTDKELLLKILRYLRRVSKDKFLSVIVEAKDLNREEMVKIMEKAGIKPLIALDRKFFGG